MILKNVHYMTRLELETELIEKRLQVENLIHEIKRKDECIKIYSNYIDNQMQKEYAKKKIKKV